jgi:hypothetical protein
MTARAQTNSNALTDPAAGAEADAQILAEMRRWMCRSFDGITPFVQVSRSALRLGPCLVNPAEVVSVEFDAPDYARVSLRNGHVLTLDTLGICFALSQKSSVFAATLEGPPQKTAENRPSESP